MIQLKIQLKNLGLKVHLLKTQFKQDMNDNFNLL